MHSINGKDTKKKKKMKCVLCLVSISLPAYGLSLILCSFFCLSWDAQFFIRFGGPSIAISVSMSLYCLLNSFDIFVRLFLMSNAMPFLFTFSKWNKTKPELARRFFFLFSLPAWTIYQMELYFPAEFKFQNLIRYFLRYFLQIELAFSSTDFKPIQAYKNSYTGNILLAMYIYNPLCRKWQAILEHTSWRAWCFSCTIFLYNSPFSISVVLPAPQNIAARNVIFNWLRYVAFTRHLTAIQIVFNQLTIFMKCFTVASS